MFSFFKKKKKKKKTTTQPTEKVEKNATRTTKSNSSITFEVDSKLKVTVRCRINNDVVNALISKGYLTDGQKDDNAAIKFALILMTNEVTDQIILSVNNNEDV